MRLRRALFVSGSLGKGHDVVAEAYGAALEAHGVVWEVLDAMALLGRGRAGAGHWVFRHLLSLTAAYDAFHFSQLRDGGPLGRAADRAAIEAMHGAFAEAVAAFGPELIVPVFATGAGATARLKAEGLPVPSVVAITDSFAHRMWVHEETDLFLVTSATAAESVRRYRPEAPVEVVGAPVRPQFLDLPTREEARSRLGIPSDATCVLLMSGAWGLGPLDAVASALADAGMWVVAVAGTNTRLVDALTRAAASRHRLLPFGYTDRVPELMTASDVVVTSSGDTCREARVVGRGIVLLDVVPGHGRENLMHELELGAATVCQTDAGSIVRAVRAFLADPRRSRPAPLADPGGAGTRFLAALGRVGLTVG